LTALILHTSEDAEVVLAGMREMPPFLLYFLIREYYGYLGIAIQTGPFAATIKFRVCMMSEIA
jgi:hypothetical protein